MSENISIQEGGQSRAFGGVARMETETADGEGSCFWVPESERELESEYIMQNGDYTPSKYAFSELNVNVIEPIGDFDITIDEFDLPHIEIDDVDLSIDPSTGLPEIKIDGVEVDLPDISDSLDLDADLDISLDLEDMDLDISGLDLDGIDSLLSIDLDTLEIEKETCPSAIEYLFGPGGLTYNEGQPIDFSLIQIGLLDEDGLPIIDEDGQQILAPQNELLYSDTIAKNESGSWSIASYIPKYGWEEVLKNTDYIGSGQKETLWYYMDDFFPATWGGISGQITLKWGPGKSGSGKDIYYFATIECLGMCCKIWDYNLYRYIFISDVSMPSVLDEWEETDGEYSHRDNLFARSSGTVEVNGKKYYCMWGRCAAIGKEAEENEIPESTADPTFFNSVGFIASYYGNENDSKSAKQTITVEWVSPCFKTLETSFDITVLPGQKSASGGHWGGTTISGDHGGSHYSGKF